MRLVRSLRALLFCGLTVGCAHHAPAPHGEATVLDNHGGYSHAGRRVVLHPEGRYTDTKYTDVTGDQSSERGFYRLDAEKRQLTLSPKRGDAEQLYRVDYDGRQYWVLEQDRQRITELTEDWLRQISLRAETK